MPIDWAKFGERARAAKAKADTESKLATMGLSLKVMREADHKAARQARAQDGTFHADVNDHTRLLSHLATNHGMAILATFRTSTRNATAAHTVAHEQRPDGHDLGDME